MGVDWYACETCGDTFPDCGDYVWCECGRHWCSDSCAESDCFRQEEDGYTPKGSNYAQETSCEYCRGEEFEDSELLAEALMLLGKTRQDIVGILKAKEGAK